MSFDKKAYTAKRIAEGVFRPDQEQDQIALRKAEEKRQRKQKRNKDPVEVN